MLWGPFPSPKLACQLYTLRGYKAQQCSALKLNAASFNQFTETLHLYSHEPHTPKKSEEQ